MPVIDQIHLNHRKLNKKQKPYKRRCYPKEACISGRPNYGNLLFPVCPVLRDILIDKPLYDISKIDTTNSPLLDSVNRVRYVLRKLIELKPDEETIVRCAHTKEPYNRNFLTEWLKPIEDDLKTLPEKMQDNCPATSEKLAKLIKELKAVVDSYTIYSRTNLFLQFPSYLFGKDGYGFSNWRSQLTSSKPYGIVDEGGSNKEPDALVCASKGAMACTYPIDAIEASRPICEELEEVAKHLDREKTVSTDDIAIEDKELTILIELAEGSDKTYSQVEIEAATSIPRGTLKDKLLRLESIELIHRPLGKRKGYQITDKGRKVAHRNE